VAVLTATARLLDVLPFGLGRAEDGFAIRHLRLAYIGNDIELALHTVDENLEVQLAHAGDDSLVRLFVGLDAEGRVFVREFPERDAHLLLVGLRLRLDAERDHRLGELNLLKHDRIRLVAERVRGLGVLQPHGSGDFAGEHLLDFGTLVGLELDDASDALLGPGRRVVHVGTGGERARVHAEEGQRANKRVGLELKRERAERLIVVCVALYRFAGLRVRAGGGLEVDGRRQVVHDRVEDELDALVLECRAGVDRKDFVIDDCLTQNRFELVE